MPTTPVTPLQSQPPKKKRKRGGLAGVWDRNKKVIKPIASGIAGTFGGPGAAALVGSAMGGLDRKGKGGIGFDVGQGIRGGVSGAAAGAAGAGIRGMFTGTGFAGGMRGYAGKIPGVKGAFTKQAPGMVPLEQTANANIIAARGGRPIVNALGGIGDFIKNNPTVAGAGLTAGAQMSGQSSANRMARERFNMDRYEFDRQNAQREEMRKLLMPYFIQLQQRLGRTA